MFLQATPEEVYEDIGEIEGYQLKLISLKHFQNNEDLANQYREIYRSIYYNTRWHINLEAELAGERNEHALSFVLFDKDKVIAGLGMNFINDNDMYYERMVELAQHCGAKNTVRAHSVFTTAPYRNKGLNSALTEFSNRYMLEHYKADHIVGLSAHCNALRLYKNLGAQLFHGDIENLSRYISPEDSHTFFDKFMTDPELKGWKFDNGIRFWYDLNKLYS